MAGESLPSGRKEHQQRRKKTGTLESSSFSLSSPSWFFVVPCLHVFLFLSVFLLSSLLDVGVEEVSSSSFLRTSTLCTLLMVQAEAERKEREIFFSIETRLPSISIDSVPIIERREKSIDGLKQRKEREKNEGKK